MSGADLIMQGQPRWSTGDLVLREPAYAMMPSKLGGRRGMVVGVTKSNGIDNHLANVYNYVYYVFFHDGKFEGPLFQSELHDA